MASSFNMPCIEREFFFLMTGIGKGCFNIFVGFCLFISTADSENLLNTIMGYCMIVAGLIFLFLSKFKKMSDEDLHRSLSIMVSEKDSLKKGAKLLGSKSKGLAKDIISNNKEEIKQGLYDNKEVIAQAAADNPDILEDFYKNNPDKRNMSMGM